MGFNDYQPRDRVEKNRRRFINDVLLTSTEDQISGTGGTPTNNRREDSTLTADSGIPLVGLRQVHSDIVYPLEPHAAGHPLREGDALITPHSNVLISVQTADCMPVLIVDAERRVVAAVHAGWRGTLKRVVEKTVKKMQDLYSTNPVRCIAVIGPSIRGCCYEVGTEVIEAFHDEFNEAWRYGHLTRSGSGRDARAPRKSDGEFLDLPTSCRYQLLQVGLSEENIFADPPCTSCHTDQFFSHRAESGKTGRMMAVIGMIQGC